jgi:hypothetical protein
VDRGRLAQGAVDIGESTRVDIRVNIRVNRSRATMTQDDKRSFSEAQRAKLTQIKISLKAGKLASDKEDYDALTWGRVLELSQELDSLDAVSSPNLKSEIAKELAFIARTNIALSFRFGNAQPQTDRQPDVIAPAQQIAPTTTSVGSTLNTLDDWALDEIE